MYVIILIGTEVVNNCFGRILNESYLKSIEEFEKTYRKLPHGTDPEKNLGVIIKAQCVFQHIPETIERTGKCLGVFSAVAFEHVHGDFIETLKIFKVHPTHPHYRKQFKSCVVHYDSHHISYI